MKYGHGTLTNNRLDIVSIPFSGCLTFFYHMNVYMGEISVLDGNRKVFRVSNPQGDEWRMVELPIVQSNTQVKHPLLRSHKKV